MEFEISLFFSYGLSDHVRLKNKHPLLHLCQSLEKPYLSVHIFLGAPRGDFSVHTYKQTNKHCSLTCIAHDTYTSTRVGSNTLAAILLAQLQTSSPWNERAKILQVLISAHFIAQLVILLDPWVYLQADFIARSPEPYHL